jgi:hypothetical protein
MLVRGVSIRAGKKEYNRRTVEVTTRARACPFAWARLSLERNAALARRVAVRALNCALHLRGEVRIQADLVHLLVHTLIQRPRQVTRLRGRALHVLSTALSAHHLVRVRVHSRRARARGVEDGRSGQNETRGVRKERVATNCNRNVTLASSFVTASSLVGAFLP